MLNGPFELKPCPQSCGHECGANLPDCPTYRTLPGEFQTKCGENLHLLRYMHALPLEEIGMPNYHATLSRGMKGTKNINLIYPTSGETFVHILANPEDIRDYYIPVEPSVAEDLDGKLDEIETGVADSVEELEGIRDEGERVEAILDLMDRMVTVGGSNPQPNGNGKPNADGKSKGKGKPRGKRKKKKGGIAVTSVQYQGLRYLLRRKLQGMGILEPFLADIYIEDISMPGLGNIFVEHNVFGGLRSVIGFEAHEELDKFVIQLAENIKHPVTFRDPVVDATLPDGSRINIVYGTDVSKRGSNFTIRKFAPTPMSVIELIQLGTLSYEMAAYLSLIIQEQMNLFVSGETASGKTTLMNAIATFITPDSKVVSIEDTPEVQVPHPNWIRGVTRGSSKGTDASEVSMFDLLKAALRQRPNIIIVGEIRGAEGAIAFQAMQTGHACMSTFHAASVTKLIQRMTGDPINVPRSYVDNLNVVVIAQGVRLPTGQSARRVTSISEIVGYDSIANAFSFIEVFTWSPYDDTHFFKGLNNSYLLEEKIGPRRGIPREKKSQIYSQIRQRAEVLKRLHDQKIMNFYDVYAILSKAYREGYFR